MGIYPSGLGFLAQGCLFFCCQRSTVAVNCIDKSRRHVQLLASPEPTGCSIRRARSRPQAGYLAGLSTCCALPLKRLLPALLTPRSIRREPYHYSPVYLLQACKSAYSAAPLQSCSAMLLKLQLHRRMCSPFAQGAGKCWLAQVLRKCCNFRTVEVPMT